MLGTVVVLHQHSDSGSKALGCRAKRCGSLGLLSIAVVPSPTPQSPVRTYPLVWYRLGNRAQSTAHLPHPPQLVILAPYTPGLDLSHVVIPFASPTQPDLSLICGHTCPCRPPCLCLLGCKTLPLSGCLLATPSFSSFQLPLDQSMDMVKI